MYSNFIYDIFVLAMQFAQCTVSIRFTLSSVAYKSGILAIQLEKGLFKCLYMFAVQIIQNTNLKPI